MTVTAADVKKAVEERAKCPGIDEWIVESLMPSFINRNGANVQIDERVVARRWHKDNFLKSMNVRGFKVEYKAEDRPAEYPYFDIGL